MSVSMGVTQWPPRPRQPAMPARPPEWTVLAVCAEVDPALFFPEDSQHADRATAICRSCEVRLCCLKDSLDRPAEGVWGGFSEYGRRRVAREYAAGRPLADIIAEDDARYYARLEAGTYDDRRPAIEREKRRVNREAIAAATTTQSQEKAA